MKKRITVVLTLLFFIGKAAVAMQTDSGKFFTGNGRIRIYYEVKGGGFPVVLVHGFTGTSQGWKRGKLYSDLLKAGYQVIVLDLPGNGRSDKSHRSEAYANNAEARDIMLLMDTLGISSYDVVGYSRGSIIVSSLLVLDKRVKKAVMGGMGDAYTDPHWPRRIHAYKALMGDTSYHDVDGMMKYIRSEHFDNQALALQQKFQPYTPPRLLKKVKKPVLIIRGTEDKDDGSETGLQKMIPGSQLVYVPGDHNAAFRTQELSDAVLKFFQ